MLSNEQTQLKRELSGLVNQIGIDRTNPTTLLQAFFAEHDNISENDMQVFADVLNIPPVEVYSILSFYPSLSAKYRSKYVFRLCQASCCWMADDNDLADHLEKALGISFGESTPDGLFSLVESDCLGFCDQAPVLQVNDQIYTQIDPSKVDQIIQACKDGKLDDSDPVPTSHIGSLSLDSIQPYTGIKAVVKKPQAEILASPSHQDTNRKLSFEDKNKFSVAISNGVDYILCNADEGEPFAFSNRTLLASHLDYVIEGMAIAAYVCRASKGILYLPQRYAYLQAYLQTRLDEYRRKNILGVNLFEKDGFAFDIEIRVGPGEYIGREETTLISALEGHRPEPAKFIEAQHSYLVKSVDTFAWLAYLCATEQEWPSDADKKLSLTPKICSISGDCQTPGVYEIPAGKSISEVLKMSAGEKAQVVQIGGISGKCYPKSAFEETLKMEDLSEANSIIIYGPQRDLLSVAENILKFFSKTSCGQCVPCRNGVPILLEYVSKLIHRNKKDKISTSSREIRSLAETVHLTSKCSLGQSAPVAFLSILDILMSDQ